MEYVWSTRFVVTRLPNSATKLLASRVIVISDVDKIRIASTRGKYIRATSGGRSYARHGPVLLYASVVSPCELGVCLLEMCLF